MSCMTRRLVLTKINKVSTKITVKIIRPICVSLAVTQDKRKKSSPQLILAENLKNLRLQEDTLAESVPHIISRTPTNKYSSAENTTHDSASFETEWLKPIELHPRPNTSPDNYPYRYEIGEAFLNVMHSSNNNMMNLSYALDNDTPSSIATSQLQEFLLTGNMEKIPLKKGLKREELLTLINDICCEWFDNQVKLGFTKDTKKQAFALAYIWTKTRFKTLNIHYEKVFMYYFLDNANIKELTALEFAFCMFLVAKIRHFPNASKYINRDGNHQNLQYIIHDELENVILLHLPFLSPTAVGMITAGLYKSRLMIKPENNKLRESLIGFLLNMDDKYVVRYEFAVSNILKLLTTRDFNTNLGQIDQLMKKYITLMPSLKHFTLIR